jgi:ankyrin repeat protein
MATFLHLAEEERFDELKQALDLGLFTENINVTNRYSQTMLYFASRRNQIELCKMLLDRGANPDIGDCRSFLSLKKKSNLFISFFPPKRTNKRMQRIKEVIEIKNDYFTFLENEIIGLSYEKQNINDFMDNGLTPLMYAAKLGRLGCVYTLLDYDANPNIQDKKGRTALHYCLNRKNGSSDEAKYICRILVIRGADISLADFSSVTPLKRAEKKGLFRLYKFLLKNLNKKV